MAVCAGTHHCGHALRFLHHGPTVAEAHAGNEAGRDVAGLRAGHLGDGLLAEDALAVEFTLVQHHAIKFGEVGTAGNEAARRDRERRLLGQPDQVHLEDELAVLLVVSLRQALHLLGRRVERGVLHSQRVEDALLEKGFERFAGDDLDDAAERVDPGVAVGPLAARLELQRESGDGLRGFGQRAIALHVDLGKLLGIVRQAARVREQVANLERPARLLIADEGRVRELGQVLRHVIVWAELPFVDENHDGDGRDRLGHRGNAEERVLLHGRLVGEVALAHGFVIQDAIFVADQRHGTGEVAVVDELLHRGLDAAERKVLGRSEGREQCEEGE